MSDISMDLVKELRSRTGVGVGVCKKALEEASGDMELAITNLRKSGMTTAVKKEGRATKEGVIVYAETSDRLALVEISAETDFVINNDSFKDFATNIAEEAAKLGPSSLADFLNHKSSKEAGLTINEYRASIVQKIGENIQIKRLLIVRKEAKNSLGLYSHMNGKIICLVELEGSSKEVELAREIALHVAAENPLYVNIANVPPEVVSKEREIAKEQVKDKPANVMEKILEGKINFFYDQVCLTRQKFVKNPEITIAQLLEKTAKEKGIKLSLKHFIRWQVGEAQ